mmetsp:Transcript_101750/g.175681  ORF Transcript_101750/g.175681 Transcript_101750/m.175681 type:complete len:87 (-) Transcript_101750:748-1008(-)
MDHGRDTYLSGNANLLQTWTSVSNQAPGQIIGRTDASSSAPVCVGTQSADLPVSAERKPLLRLPLPALSTPLTTKRGQVDYDVSMH